ncbi:MAG: membrane dipeptidase [Rhodobacteraceae bacterium]|nr:membrane dipeptidase [Paracoccaceae bacterium]
MRRRSFLGGGAGALMAAGAAGYWFGLRPLAVPQPAEVGFTLTAEETAAAQVLMRRVPVIDAHAHPGRTFLRDAEDLSFLLRLYRLIGGTFEAESLSDMRASGMAAAVFNGVGDIQVITLGDGGLSAWRPFAPDEAWQSYRRQIANLRALADAGHVTLCLTPDDVVTSHAQGRLGAILAMEGADALEGDASRVAQLHADGVRMLTLVHYRDNDLGHIMTGDAGGGLSGAGREAVVAMNEVGMMIDLAHAAEATAFDVIAVSRKPVILSHTHINAPELSNPRFVSPELAQAVAETGGYIGAWPAGIGLDSLNGFADRVVWLIEQMGADHVALGSDMDANYRPVLETYRKMPLLVGALMRRGLDDETLGKILGGNVLRVWRAVQNTQPG